MAGRMKKLQNIYKEATNYFGEVKVMFKSILISLMMLVAGSGLCLANALPGDVEAGKAVPEVETAAVLPHKHTLNCHNTEAEPVQIVCILDRSGSMRQLAGDTIGGYNAFIEKQRQEKGKAEVTTVLFDDKYEKLIESVDIGKVPELTSKEYYARGMTALLDAVGRTITSVFSKMEEEGICPARRRVLFLIMTDGKENDSKEYDKASVKALVDTATKEYNWNFVFMGANIDSAAEAGAIGIHADHAVNYTHDAEGVRASFDKMSAAASEMRETGNVSEDWKNGK